MALTVADYFGKHLGLVDAVTVKAAKLLLTKVNDLLKEIGIEGKITSGYRTPAHNKAIGGSPNSAHCTGQAVDLADADIKIKEACRANDYELLKKYDLYMESGTVATNWCHLTTRMPRSGRREFMP